MTAPVAALPRAPTPSRLGPVGEQVVCVVSLVIAAVIGRATIVDGLTLGMVWPASGVAVVWYAVSARRGPWHVVVTTVLFAAVTFAIGSRIDASWQASLVFLIANAVQIATAAVFLRRLLFSRASLFSAESARALSTVRGVLGLAGGSAAAGLAGATVGVVCWALFVPDARTNVLSLVLWWARNTVGIIEVVALVLLLASVLRQRRTGTPDPLLTNRSVLDSLDAALARSTGQGAPDRGGEPAARRHRLMVGALFVTSAAAYSVDLSHWGGPTAFPLLAFTIWSGLLCSALVTVLHTLMSTALLVFWTLQGRGPFSLFDSPRAMAAEVQLYVAFILVLGLLLAAARSEIRDGLSRVVTAEDSSADRADLLSAVTEAMSDGLMVVDASSTIVRANRTAIELLGLDPSVPVRCDELGMLRPDGTRLPPELYPSTLARRDGATTAVDLVLIRHDGVPRTLSVRATRLDEADGRARRTPESAPVVVVFTDVTEERAQHDYLAGFAGMVAHDLRSPLSTVRGWLDMASLVASDDPTARARELERPLERATAGAVQMGRLIDDLMTHVSAHGQVLELEPIDVAGLAREVAEAHGVAEALSVEDLPPVWADRALVHQLVTNLVGNAAKYRHPDRPLALLLHGHERHGIVTLVLEDNGRGIPEAELDRVFERFYRVEEHRSVIGGTGLGLAMCRTIVERHGGTIVALPGRDGAAIEVTLAAVPVPVAGDEPDEPGPPRRHLRPVAD